MAGSSPILNELLLADHQEVKGLLERFDSLPVADRTRAFWELTSTLVRHEVAEEEVLYPAVRKYVDDGSDLAEPRIEEQSEAEKLLAEMEKALPDGTEFMQMFAKLRDSVLEHAEAEEQLIFPALAGAVDIAEQRHLGERYERAKAMAPTHPHPHAPDTPPANMLVGPVAALVDRVRDAVHTA
jgi:hemerythrin superfamily protein